MFLPSTRPTPRPLRLPAALALWSLTTLGCAASVSSRDASADAAVPNDVADAPALPARLPDGFWAGVLQRVCTDGATAMPDYETRITANEQRTETVAGGFAGTMLDRYNFTAPGEARWLDLQGGELGRCTLTGTVFACRVTADAAVQSRRTLDFAGGSLAWDEEITAGGVTCRVRGTLRPR